MQNTGSSMEVDPEYNALMNHLNLGYEPNAQTSIQSLPFQQVQETVMVDISTPRTPVSGGQLAPVGVTPAIWHHTSWDAKK
eukprot:3860046-Amphidinium_carterae.1